MTTRLLLLLWSLIITCPALEVIGEPAWLAKTMTPSWRQVRLGTVLDDLGTTVGCRVKRDEDLADIAQGQEVTITLTGAVRLRRVLELLEQTQDLVITAEPQQMTVARFATWRVTSRRAISIDLREYGALLTTSFPEEIENERQVPRVLDPDGRPAQPVEPEPEPDATMVVEYLKGHLEHGDDAPTLVLATGVHLLATVNPQEERLLRRQLDQMVRMATWSSTWSTAFGVLAADQPLVTGIISHDAADALRKRLQVRKQFHLQATDLHPVRASDQRTQEVMASAQPLNDGLWPVAEVLTTGWSCYLRPTAGRERQRLSFALSWSEARPLTTSTLVVPPIPADPARERPAGGDQTLALAKPAVWSWEPAGDVFLPDRHALVLVAPHDEGRAIIILESATPSPISAHPFKPAPEPPAMSLVVEGDPLLVAIDRIAMHARTGLAIHHSAQQVVREEAQIVLREQPWKEVLRALFLHRSEIRLEDGVMMVHEWGVSGRSRMEHRLYSTATMTTPIAPRPGPRLGAQKVARDDRPPELVIHGRSHQDEPNVFIEEVQALIDPESWSNEGVAIEDYNGAVVIDQTPEVHHDIEGFLVAREQRRARQVVVRVHRLAKPPDSSGLILDATTWTSLAKDLSPDVALLVVDGKRNHHFSGMRRAYIAADFFENGLGSPVMGLLTSGLMIEVEPHITTQGISTRIRLQATVSETMATSPVKDAAGRLLFNIDLPDQRTDQADDIRLIPPGGAALYRFDDRTYAVGIDLLDAVTAP